MRTWQRRALACGLAAGAYLAARCWFRRRPYGADWQLSTLQAPHGDRIAMTHIGRGHRAAVIVAHGLAKSKNDHRIFGLCQYLACQMDVIAFDWPGHGASGGTCDLDLQSRADELARIINHARSLGYARVGLIGCSMGAAAAIVAVGQGAPVDTLVAVSTPLRPVLAGKRIPSWPLAPFARMTGTRLAPRIGSRTWPLAWIDRVSPTPLLSIHNGLDTLVPARDSHALYGIARQPKAYIEAPTALHAATASTQSHIAAWLQSMLDTERDSEPPN